MNVELRIETIERLLTDVSQRRQQAPAAHPTTHVTKTPRAGWDGLERDFRAALISAKRQRETSEVIFRS